MKKIASMSQQEALITLHKVSKIQSILLKKLAESHVKKNSPTVWYTESDRKNLTAILDLIKYGSKDLIFLKNIQTFHRFKEILNNIEGGTNILIEYMINKSSEKIDLIEDVSDEILNDYDTNCKMVGEAVAEKRAENAITEHFRNIDLAIKKVPCNSLSNPPEGFEIKEFIDNLNKFREFLTKK